MDSIRGQTLQHQGATEKYNRLVSLLIGQLENSSQNPWQGAIPIHGSSSVSSLSGVAPAGLDVASCELIPAEQLTFSGELAPKQRILSQGLGASVVAVRPKDKSLSKDKIFVVESHYRTLTAIVRFSGNRAVIELIDPFQKETVYLSGKMRTIATDYSSTVSLALSRERVDRIGIARVINPQRYAATARIAFVQPYDPEKIPVLFIHGLNDTAATWLPMYLGLIQDKEIRKRFQFWVFSYPSGYPFPYSALLLRRELSRVAGEHPEHKRIVLVGHSMGGVISRMMISNAGDSIWRKYFGSSPGRTRLLGPSRKLLEEALVFNARPDISRAIFICAPHRGSQMASNFIGRFGSRLIRTPSLIADVTSAAASFMDRMSDDEAGVQLERAPNSIDTLSPRNRFVRSTASLPIAPGVPYHSIIGDRGKGNTPRSSDGVVAYWSSHLDGATSEKIVPSGHNGHLEPEAIEEVRRILKVSAR